MLKILRNILLLPAILAICLLYSVKTATAVVSDLTDDELYLAATLWGEARGDSEGMQAIANTIMNRKKYYESQQKEGSAPVSIKSIISDTNQYASWKGKSFDTSAIIKQMAEYQGSDKESWETCVNYAKLALSDSLGDTTFGATGYYSKNATEIPEWARGASSTSTIGNTVVVHGVKPEDISSNGSGTNNSAAYKTGGIPVDSSSAGSSKTCDGVESVSRDISPKTNSGYGVISDTTMQNMSNMLDTIYKNLGRVFMLGHGVLCYATKVAYSCFGVDVPGLKPACWIKAPNLSFFICGLAIYITAFMMSVAIGMYFVDICFKLGFAIMYLPIAIALWPFAPTRSKFGEAFGMILHNSLLYAMMSIGLSYAIVLIYNGILGDTSNWTNFWSAIEKESSEILAEQFSLSSTRIMVIMFCLIFGFKIIASSVNEYLDYFFSDGLMGGQSPMHYLGTQALGSTAGAAIGSMAGYTSDFIQTQTGRGVEAIGNTLVNFSNGNYGLVGKAAKTITSPLAQIQVGLNRLRTRDFNHQNANASASVDGSATSGGQTASNPQSSATIGDIASSIEQATRPDATTLSPSNILSKTGSTVGGGIKGTYNAIRHPQATYRTFKQLAMENVSDENSPYQNGKLIITNTGKVIFRKITPDSLLKGLDENNSLSQNAGQFALNSVTEGAKITRATGRSIFGAAGRMTSNLGKDMQRHWDKKGSSNFWTDQQTQREEDEEKKRLEDLIEQNLSNQHDEGQE